MLTDSTKNFWEKIKSFDKTMIETAKNNNDIFEFEDEQYFICSDGVFVQTLIDNRILYRIFIDEHRNDTSIHHNLLKFLTKKRYLCSCKNLLLTEQISNDSNNMN